MPRRKPSRNHKLVSPREEKFTPNAIRQQQLAWFMYITEGYLANLQHALTVNNFCMHTADIAVVRRMIDSTGSNADRMRTTFFPE